MPLGAPLKRAASDGGSASDSEDDLFSGAPVVAGVAGGSGSVGGGREAGILAALMMFGLALALHRTRTVVADHWERYGSEECALGGLYINPRHYTDGPGGISGTIMVGAGNSRPNCRHSSNAARPACIAP